MLNDAGSNKEYLPIAGDSEYVKLALKFAYESDYLDEGGQGKYLAGVHRLSGTGSCRIGGHFFSKSLKSNADNDKKKKTAIYCPSPIWGNHKGIFQECGLEVQRDRYYDRSTNRLDFYGMMEDIRDAPAGSVVLLHVCAHNPTGCDPTLSQWESYQI